MRRALGVVALLVTGCGPMQLAGNWNVTINGFCSGTMVLAQDVETFGGEWACEPGQGTISGSLSGADVSLSFATPGYHPILLTGTAITERSISGTANGSGFSNRAFRATK